MLHYIYKPDSSENDSERITEGPLKKVLVVAGFDPSGGAGIILDSKVLRTLGCYGLVAITSITVQNSKKVYSIKSLDPVFFEEQIRKILDDVGTETINAVKIGLINDLKIAQALKKILEEYKLKNIVFDTVLSSTSGYKFVDDKLLEFIKNEFLNLCDVVTPNKSETEKIFNVHIGLNNNIDEKIIEQVRRKMESFGLKNCIIKGGHISYEKAEDVLIMKENVIKLSAEKINSTDSIRGTGCLFSSALSAFLAKDYELPKAFELAKSFVTNQIKKAIRIGSGKLVMNP